MPNKNEIKQQALNAAKEKLKTTEAARQVSSIHQQLEGLKRKTDEASNQKVPWLREYYKLFTKQESNPNLAIGRMAKAKNDIVLKQGVLITAAELCEDPTVKEELLRESEELKNHQAIKNYEKYTQGLAYIVGEREQLEDDVKLFFQKELGCKITQQKIFKEDRVRNIQEVRSTESDLEQQYMEEVAAINAQQVYAVEGLDYYMPLTDQFLSDWPLSERPKETQYRDRMSPGAVCVAYMLRKGYSIEEILDPEQFKEEKKEIGQLYREKREANDINWLAEQMSAGSEALMGAVIKYMKDHKAELKNTQDMAFHANSLGILVQYCFDMSQEIQFCIKDRSGNRKPFAEGIGKSYEEMEHLADRLNKFSSMNNWIVGRKIPLTMRYAQRDSVCEILANQIELNHVLDMIENDEPDMESHLLGPEEHLELKWQIFTIPEMDQNMEESVKPTQEAVKAVGKMLNGTAVKEKQLDYVVPEYTISAKNAIIDEWGIEQRSEKRKVPVVFTKEEKQVITTDVPAKMGPFLRELESKRSNFRGEAKKNSDAFNTLLNVYDKVVENMCKDDTSYEEKLKNLAELKAAASNYMGEKRKQKGHTSKDIPDYEVDKQMLGLIKGGKSIFTTRGKERYGFAERLVGHSIKMEKAVKEAQAKQKAKEASMKEIGNKNISDKEVVNKETANKEIVNNAVPKGADKNKEQKNLQKKELMLEELVLEGPTFNF